MSIRVGQRLGNYQLVRLLGQGGFAQVYLGEHIYLKTQAAIKVLHTQLGNDEQVGFLDEAHTIAHLRHPSIVRVLEFGVEASKPFLVMTYAPNGTLRQRHPTSTSSHCSSANRYAFPKPCSSRNHALHLPRPLRRRLWCGLVSRW